MGMEGGVVVVQRKYKIKFHKFCCFHQSFNFFCDVVCELDFVDETGKCDKKKVEIELISRHTKFC